LAGAASLGPAGKSKPAPRVIATGVPSWRLPLQPGRRSGRDIAAQIGY